MAITTITEAISIKPESCSEIHKIQPDSLYLTFNAPQVDEYHRGIFISTPNLDGTKPRYSGVLFHAAYSSPSKSDVSTSSTPSASTTPTQAPIRLSNAPALSQLTESLLNIPKVNVKAPSTPPSASIAPYWHLDRRSVKDLSRSPTLCLCYRFGVLNTSVRPIEEQVELIKSVIKSVPLGRANREREIGPLRPDQGNKALEDYDCIIWTADALDALERAGIVSLSGSSGEEVLSKARAIAGPKDARTMVGVDFGGLRVMN